MKMLVRSGFFEVSLLGLQMITFLIQPHIAFSLCMHREIHRENSSVSSSYKGTSPIRLGLHPYELTCIWSPISKYNHLGG